MNMLAFLSTVTVEEFKTQNGAKNLTVKTNSETGKCFFSCGSKSGPVTSKYPDEPLTKPVVSEVISRHNGESFYLLHNEAEENENITVVESF